MGGSTHNTTSATAPISISNSSSSSSSMSSTLNLVMTTFGFLVSAIFITFVLLRLLCARFQARRFASSGTVGQIFYNRGSERGACGVNQSLISLFPTIKFSEQLFASNEDAMCAVCLGEYEDGDVLQILPICGHTFHVSCIYIWLQQQLTCPVCRVNLQDARRSILSPLLTEAAWSRFTPSVIRDSLFQQPLSSGGIRTGSVSQGSHECAAHIIDLRNTTEGSQF